MDARPPRAADAPPILSPFEETLVRFLNAPFWIAVPVLLGTIASLVWSIIHYGP